ncbi:DNA polymerase zeta, partial [Coemansia sp. RSA 988]
MNTSWAHGQVPNLGNNAEETVVSALDVQIFNIDSHVAPPTPADCALHTPFNIFESPLKNVPVIRIFGATRSGQRICLHVHQAWPYICVRYSGNSELCAVQEFGYQLGRSLNHALNLSLGCSEETAYISAVAPVKGTPFYGYTVGYQPFFKIQFANPGVMARASTLLASGAVMGQKFEVFEAHLSYVLQFLINNNLSGNGWIRLDNVRFRSPLPDITSGDGTSSAGRITNSNILSKHRWVPLNVPSYLVNPPPPERTSHCELEADTTVADIINRRLIRERRIHQCTHEGDTDVNDGPLVHSLALIWADENRRRSEHGMEGLVPADGHIRNGTSGGDDMHAQRGLQWSNHWRMQSLFESVLEDGCGQHGDHQADQNLSKSNCGSWLDSWPTCQGVDLCHGGLEFDGVICKAHFYNCAGACVSSDCVDLPPPVEQQLNNKGCSQIPNDLSIDMGLVVQSRSGHGSDETGYTSGFTDISSDAGLPIAGALGTDVFDEDCASELDELDCIDHVWLESELSKVEEVVRVTTGSCESVIDIPQLDGSEDNSCGKSDYSSQKPHSPGRRLRRHGKRALLPLDLLPSSVPVSTMDADCGSPYSASPTSAHPQQHTSDFTLENYECKGGFDQAFCRRMRPAVQGKYHSSLPRRGKQGEQSRSKATHTMSPNVGLKKSTTQRVRYTKDDIFVDIPHRMGSICKKREVFVTNDVDDLHVRPYSKFLTNARACSSVDRLHSTFYAYMDGFFAYLYTPPSFGYLHNTLARNKIPEVATPIPIFSNSLDVLPKHRADYTSITSTQSRTIHSLPLFGPIYISESDSDTCALDVEDGRAACKGRRYFMWSLGSGQALNLVSNNLDISCFHWKNGWWVFSQRSPNRLILRANDSMTGMTQVHKDTLATPVQRRQRDQSDLKWSSVLGKLSQHPAAPSSSNVPAVRCLLPVSSTGKHSGRPKKPLEGRGVSMSLMALELLTMCGQDMLPDPRLDKIILAIGCFAENGVWKDGGDTASTVVIWTCDASSEHIRLGLPSYVRQQSCADEQDMIRALVEWVCQSDPDIMCGYDIHKGSWGYLLERAKVVYGQSLDCALSRLVYAWEPHAKEMGYNRAEHSWSHRKGTSIKIRGRHMLNVWRLMRNELNLTSYTFEKVINELLGEQSPHYSPSFLAMWFLNGSAVARIRAVRHVLYRAKTVLRILEKSDIIERAVSFAMVIGIDFYSVLTRGSQLRVESLVARIAHPELYMLPSPTREQVAQQRAAECLPLVLEPQSRYYTDPVVVLDFQSLYPSIIIAYNYCYSTCLGSLEHITTASTDLPDSGQGTVHRLGYTDLRTTSDTFAKLKDHITISPNGVMFVKPSIRKGLLGRMLQEFTASRVMIKDAMKRWCAGDKPLHRKLDSWQLGLKLISNVTYGYVGASFSGRMPCVEIADAIVQSGRETLENAIRLIHSRHAEWGASVVYGDTDSLFLHMPGKSRQSAFQIGRQIAAAVTELNPAPVKLNFEKVYQPCVLLTKKRYMGWVFSSEEQVEPLLEAKGMELVRRDGCVATQRVLEGSINTLFETNDLSLLKTYIQDRVTEIMRGEVPVPELVISKETRIHTYSGRTLPPHAKVAADGMMRDPQVEPEHGERVPYLVVSGSRRSRLIDQVVSPGALVAQPHLRPNFQYYIDKQLLPALDRILTLVGVDVRAWVSEMPRRLRSSIYDEFLSDQSDSDGGDEANQLHNCSDQTSGSEQQDVPFHGGAVGRKT